MTEETETNFTVPSDPELRKRIRDAVAQASAVTQMIEDQKSALKDVVTFAKEELEVPKKIFTKMVKAFHQQSYPAMAQETEIFELFYETIMEDPK